MQAGEEPKHGAQQCRLGKSPSMEHKLGGAGAEASRHSSAPLHSLEQLSLLECPGSAQDPPGRRERQSLYQSLWWALNDAENRLSIEVIFPARSGCYWEQLLNCPPLGGPLAFAGHKLDLAMTATLLSHT